MKAGITVLALIVYFLPSMISQARNKTKKGRIFVLNMLLGWTIVGWLAALVWSLMKETQPVAGAETIREELKRLERLKGEGFISSEEYRMRRSQIRRS